MALSAEDQAAVDRFLAKGGKVQRIEGVVRRQPYLWDGKSLVPVEPDTAGWRATSRIGRKRDPHAVQSMRKPAPCPKIAARRARVADLVRQKKTGPEIAQALSVALQVVYADVRRLGLTLTRATQSPAPGLVAPARVKRDPEVVTRRAAVKAAFDGVKSLPELARELDMPQATVRDHLDALGLKAPHGVCGPQIGSSIRAKAYQRRQKVKALAAEGLTRTQIAGALGVALSTIDADRAVLGITFPRGRAAGRKETATEQKERRARKRVAEIADRRRFKVGIPANGEIAKLVAADATRTLYPGTVRRPDDVVHVLKNGVNSGKIGGQVLVGRLRGVPIHTLTLEERATCPTSCPLWRGCYGNAMDKAQRMAHGPELMERLRAEVAHLCATHERILIRLHVLGDFWSVDYVAFWGALLRQYPGLHLFGFTARTPDDEIGAAVLRVRDAYPDRFMIRQSGRTGVWGSFTIDFPTERKTIGDAVVCPAQLDANAGSPRQIHCGNCAVCWSTDRPVAFIEH